MTFHVLLLTFYESRSLYEKVGDDCDDGAAAINRALAGANKLWAGTVTIHPDAKTGAHHHGALESIIYVVSGRARMRWGDDLEYVAEAEAGDFIFTLGSLDNKDTSFIIEDSGGNDLWTVNADGSIVSAGLSVSRIVSAARCP